MRHQSGSHADLFTASLTHPGLLRKDNEDSCGASPAHRVFVVCDGMGGAAAGEIASHLAVETFLQHLEPAPPARDPAPRLDAAICAANQAVFRRARETPGCEGMGTTLVAALFEPAPAAAHPPGSFWIAHVGDSRCYLLRDGRLRLLTADHSIVEEQVRAGMLTREEADVSPVRHIITRAIGSQAQVTPEVQQIEACPGDLLLLASDGLNRELSDEEIERLLNDLPPGARQPELDAACQALVDATNAHGGRDNVTVLLLQVA